MMKEKKLNIATALIVLYGVFVLTNALVYYFIILPGETDIFRGVMRAGGSFLIAYYLYKKHQVVYWVALIGSGLLTVLGVLAIILLVIGGESRPGIFVNFIPIVLLKVLLTKPQVLLTIR